ncbi:hypothetical protein ACFUJY_22490 [Streptomyces sp. NPDC057249]|uniref:hypothetical protein n=1 Tax=Streptomyces sp. NPDC057249 TaxID=3346067 RepID=UPI003626BFBC
MTTSDVLLCQSTERQEPALWCVGDELIVTAMTGGSAVEAARHLRSMPGSPRIADEHYPDAPRGERTPKPTNPAEAQFPACQYSVWEHCAPLFRMVGVLALPVQPVAERLRLHVERSWDGLDDLDVVRFRLQVSASRSVSTTAVRSACRMYGSPSRTSRPTRPWTPSWK